MQLFYVVFIYIIPVTISFSHTKFLDNFEDQQFTTLEHHKDVMVNKNYTMNVHHQIIILQYYY